MPLKYKELETDLIDFLKLCAMNEDGKIFINSPFVSKPSINLNH